MDRTVVAGLDGSPESRAAVEWAAREAELRGLPLKIVHVWEPDPGPLDRAPMLGVETRAHWSERIPRESAAGLRARHPGLEITAEHLPGRAYEILPKVALSAELLVLGSRALGALGGFLVGSVGQSVIAHTEVPVVLVRAGHQAVDEHEADPAGVPSAHTAFRPVLLGLDTGGQADDVTAFAFEEAARRGTRLRVLNAYNLPPYYVYGLAADPTLHDEITREQAAALTEALERWGKEYPSVEVVEESRPGSAGQLLADASRRASLVVVGRRVRHGRIGTHIGSVTHAVLHHATAPVAVVAHP
ncbi:universal stress protein [Streptomyces sp. NPDC006186]|uniref:universal stress protein n=1 Tax=Streptomyces sp. NPDC006186 TaxID=3155248 RepID=UPI0033A096C8